MADFGVGIRQFLWRRQPSVHRLPRLAAIVRTESTCGGDSHKDTVRVVWTQKDGVQAHSTSPRLPEIRLNIAQPGKLLPRLAAVARVEQRGIFHPGVNRIRISWRGFKVPDAFELPGMLRAVVPLVG